MRYLELRQNFFLKYLIKETRLIIVQLEQVMFMANTKESIELYQEQSTQY